MRLIIPILLISTTVLSTGYFYNNFANTCSVPIYYTIGDFDAGFPLTKAEALAVLAKAESAWEKATNRELLIYQDAADFKVNFVFDERQAQLVAEENQRQELDNNEATNAEVSEHYQQVLIEYQKLEDAYKTKVDAYEKDLAEFNHVVAGYNAEGGASPEIYEKLQQEEKKLKVTKEKLQSEANELEIIIDKLNKLSEEGNHLIEKYNEEVKIYNTKFGQEREFTQGDFQGDEINIYTFKDRNELLSVLIHEFGHALGLGHVEGKESMMYYLMEDQPNPPVLSQSDLEAFTNICGTKDSWNYRIRTFINKII